MSEVARPESSAASAVGMVDPRAPLRTARLTLRGWRDTDRDAFAALHADAEVMADLGGPLGRTAADAKLAAYMTAAATDGTSRYAVENDDGFVGYVGVVRRRNLAHPLGDHHEIGWRLVRAAWGRGYASEAAAAALANAAARGIAPIVSYTSPENARSQSVMARLGLVRDPPRDFVHAYHGQAPWRGLMWVAPPPPVAAARLGGRFYRVVFADAVDRALLGAGAAEGRFHHDGQAALYLSPEIEWADRAMDRYRAVGDGPRVAVPLDVGQGTIADLRTAAGCLAWGVDPRDVVAEWWRQRDAERQVDSWRAADAIRASGVDGMVYPSRTDAARWHLVLFRWNDRGGPMVSFAGPPIDLAAQTAAADSNTARGWS